MPCRNAIKYLHLISATVCSPNERCSSGCLGHLALTGQSWLCFLTGQLCLVKKTGYMCAGFKKVSNRLSVQRFFLKTFDMILVQVRTPANAKRIPKTITKAWKFNIWLFTLERGCLPPWGSITLKTALCSDSKSTLLATSLWVEKCCHPWFSSPVSLKRLTKFWMIKQSRTAL